MREMYVQHVSFIRSLQTILSKGRQTAAKANMSIVVASFSP